MPNPVLPDVAYDNKARPTITGKAKRVMGFRDDDEQDDFFDSVAAMADRMKLQGQKRSNYIEDHMAAAGYERVQTKEAYARVQQEGEDRQESGTSRWFGRPAGTGSRRGSDDEDRF